MGSVPVEVGALRWQSAGGVRQGRPAERGVYGRVGVDCAVQVGVDVDAQPAVGGEQTGVERDGVRRARGEAVGDVQAFTGVAFPTRLDMRSDEHPRGPSVIDGHGEAAEHAAVAVIAQCVAGEAVLADPRRGDQEQLGIRYTVASSS